MGEHQQTLKQLNTDIGECGKHYQTVEQTFLQSQNSNINTSVDRNFKNINSSIVQLRQSIKECQATLASSITARTQQFKSEETAILKTAAGKLERNKKDVTKNLQEVRAELKNRLLQSGTVGDRVKKQAGELERQYMTKIGRLHEQIGSLRCDMEFIKDKRRKQQIEHQLKIRQLPKQASPETQQFLLGLIEQEVFLQELMDFHQNHSGELEARIADVKHKFSLLLEFFQRGVQLQSHEEEHMNLQHRYLQDLWMSTEAEVWGVKKKYLIEMRKLQDKLSELQRTKKAVNWKGTELKELSDSLQQLNGSINSHIRRINESMEIVATLRRTLPQ